MTVLLLGAFTAFFLLGWPVVLAVMIPAVVYVLWNGFPIELIGQRMAYALDSFPLVAVPVFIFVGNLMNQSGITEVIYRFATTLVGARPWRARPGQHRRQPDLLRHERRRARRHRRPRPHRGQGHGLARLQARVRRSA